MKTIVEEMICIVNQLDLDTELTEKQLDTNLHDVGFNSMEFVKLVILIEEYWDIQHGEELLLDISHELTLRKLAERMDLIINECRNRL